MQESKLSKEIAKIEKDFGKGSVIYKSSIRETVEAISTGSLKLDIATGIGGFPRGKIVEIIGWESSGKSTITQQVIANAQQMGLTCLLVDGENSFDANYARNLGVNVEELLIIQLDGEGGEKCYNIAERLIRSGEIGVCIFDSQTSLLPKKVLSEDVGANAIGLHARMMSQSVPKMLNAAAVGGTLVIYISQFREKIGVMFGSPETTNGGNALKFYAHMRIDVRKTIERENGVAIANKTRCKVIKNKIAPPFGEAEFRILFGKGVDRQQEILDLSIEKGIIKKAGSWYSYGEYKIGQGEDKVKELFEGTPEFAREIEGKVLKVIEDEKNSTKKKESQIEENSFQEDSGDSRELTEEKTRD